MTRKYVLDTNLYIGAIRDPDKETDLDAFLERNAPVTYMSAVVMQELRAGAITDASARALDRASLTCSNDGGASLALPCFALRSAAEYLRRCFGRMACLSRSGHARWLTTFSLR